VDKYQPDLLYFDDTELPLGQAGLDMAAHFYNASAARNGGKPDVVLNAKQLKVGHKAALVEDYERGFASAIQPYPWQTDTCIGSWHYDRSRLEKHTYKTAGQVVRMLVDIVSKNGNLLLNIPLKGDGTIDADEEKFLADMAAWMKVNGETLYGTRPWRIFGEGPTKLTAGNFNETRTQLTAKDVRFAQKDDRTVFAFVMGIPTENIEITSLGSGGEGARTVDRVTLVGSDAPVTWKQSTQGLAIVKPERMPCEHVIVFKVTLAR
jgi:alpha-L-fucosidase